MIGIEFRISRNDCLRFIFLSGANLSGAILTDANLIYANLSGAILRDANLSGAKNMPMSKEEAKERGAIVD